MWWALISEPLSCSTSCIVLWFTVVAIYRLLFCILIMFQYTVLGSRSEEPGRAGVGGQAASERCNPSPALTGVTRAATLISARDLFRLCWSSNRICPQDKFQAIWPCARIFKIALGLVITNVRDKPPQHNPGIIRLHARVLVVVARRARPIFLAARNDTESYVPVNLARNFLVCF